MDEIRELERLKRRVEEIKNEIERSRGALEEALRNLKEEFKVDSLEKAETLLSKLTKEGGELEKELTRNLTDFKEKWESKLED